MKSIADDLALVQSPVKDEDLMVHILCQLGEDFKPIATSLRLLGSEITFHELFEKLVDYERELTMVTTTAISPSPIMATANYTKKQTRTGRRGNYGNVNTKSRNQWFSGSNNGNRENRNDIYCQYCNFAGHEIKECRKLARFLRENQVTTGGSITHNKNTPTANVTTSPLMFDTGASHHVDPNHSSFHSVSEYGGPDEIILGNGMSNNSEFGQHSIGGEHEEEGNSYSSGKHHSYVWDYFDLLPVAPNGDKKAKCSACGRVYVTNASSGTSNLRRHIPKCFDIDEPGQAKKQKRAPLDQAMYREKLAISIIKHNYPFSYVEHEETRNLHKFLHDDVKFITRNTAKADVLKIYEREKMILKDKLEKVTGRICLTSDLWSSITTDGFMALIAHYVDENWNLRKKVLKFRVIPPPHTGSILAEHLINFLADWGIEKKVFTITLDNAKYNDIFVYRLKDHLCLNNALVCDGDFTHVRCSAHVLNLIVQAGLKIIEGAIEKVRESVKYVRASAARKDKFAECIQILSLQCGKYVRQDIVTRWNSTYLMLDCALAYRRAYTRLALVDSSFQTSPSEEEWVRVEIITRLLKPFYEITTLFSGSSYPTLNLYFHHVWRIRLYIEKEMCNVDQVISGMAKDMKEKFDKYWKSYSMILSFAAILDPRYKVKLVEYCFSKLNMTFKEREEKLKRIMDGMHKLYDKEYNIQSETMHNSLTPESSNVGGNMLDELDGFDTFQSQYKVVDNEKSQLTLYLEEPSVDRKVEFDVLQYWKDNQVRYPKLAVMARDILSIPITTVASESSFSIGGRVLSKYRTSLLSSNVEALLCTRDWLFDLEDENKR
ncbi:putative transcription factor/ chromatin remodeling BED-type(Zn) family [Helianthus annuus]|nr:putative transcription factor/ chromatin remodeling BED-type(Zn) family [Helianthus annuus]